MKLTHKLCGAVLLATLGMAVAVPGITKAEESPKKGDMKVEFTRNTDADTDTTMPEFTDTDGSHPDGSGTNTRPLDSVTFGIQDVSPLDFKKHAVVNDGSVREYWAKNYTSETYSGANYVIIKDTRTTLNHKFKLSATITKPLTTSIEGSDYKLSGATITYKNINILSTQAANLALQNDTIANNSVVVQEENAADIIVNNHEDSGLGQSKIYFGKWTETETANNSEESVLLTVNSDREILEGTYTGEVTWVMSTTN